MHVTVKLLDVWPDGTTWRIGDRAGLVQDAVGGMGRVGGDGT